VLAGWRVAFDEGARADDGRRFSAAQEYRRKVRTLTGVLQLCAWLPGVLLPWRNPVWLQFMCHKLLRLLTPWLMLAVAGGAGSLALRLMLAFPRSTLVVGAVALVALLLWTDGRRNLRRAFVWGVALQAAVVVATSNGLRGRWTVWSS
jgi:hypothetical protein